MIIRSNSKSKKLHKEFIIEQPIEKKIELEELFASQIETIEKIPEDNEVILEELPKESKKSKGKKKK